MRRVQADAVVFAAGLLASEGKGCVYALVSACFCEPIVPFSYALARSLTLPNPLSPFSLNYLQSSPSPSSFPFLFLSLSVDLSTTNFSFLSQLAAQLW